MRRAQIASFNKTIYPKKLQVGMVEFDVTGTVKVPLSGNLTQAFEYTDQVPSAGSGLTDLSTGLQVRDYC